MPGWEPHSYGYHGDDGRKFGVHATPGEWHLFDTYDVIGCGFDIERKTIFFTRNGVLLGDGFTDVEDEKLWPIVGFSNRQYDLTKVSINFGVKPFVYKGDEVIANQNALVEVERQRELACEKEPPTNPSSGDSDLANAIPKKGPLGIEDKAKLQALVVALNNSSAYICEWNSLSHQCSWLLRFLLALTCETDAETDNSDANDSSNSVKKAAFAKPVLTKAISIFGTPKFVYSADSALLQRTVLAGIIDELVLICDSFNNNHGPKGVEGLTTRNIENGSEMSVVDENDVYDDTLFHLETLVICFSISKSSRDLFKADPILRLLFIFLNTGSPHFQALCCNLLKKLLPLVSPDSAEKTVVGAWQDSIISYEYALQATSIVQRQRRMPDSIPLALLVMIGNDLFPDGLNVDAFNVNQKRFFSPSSGHVPYGFGDVVLQLTDNKIHLLQTLFDCPLWRELIANSITEAFRNAQVVLETAEIATAVDGVHGAGESILRMACAACLSLCGLRSMFPGATVVTSSGSPYKIISYSEEGQKVSVLSEEKAYQFNSHKNVETMDLSTICIPNVTVQSDLTALSQPLLQHFFAVLKSLLQWFSTNSQRMREKKLTLFEHMVVWLLSVASQLLATLLHHHVDYITDQIQDANILEHLLHVSLMPIDLKGLPNFDYVYEQWMFHFARRIETPSVSMTTSSQSAEVLAESTPTDIETVIGLVNEVGILTVREGDAVQSPTTPSSLKTTSNMLHINASHRRQTDVVATAMSERLGLAKEVCVRYLEYFMLNEKDAESALKILPQEDKMDGMMDAFTSPLSQDGVEESVVSSTPDILKTIDHAQFNVGDCKLVEMPLQRNLDVIAFDLLSKQRDFLVIESTEEGFVQTVQSPIFRANFIEEDPTLISLTRFDRTFDSAITKVVSATDYRVIRKLYGVELTALEESHAVMVNAAMTVMQVRKIAARLLRDGNFTLRPNMRDLQGWSSLLKLFVTSMPSSSIVSKSMVENCAAHLLRAGSLSMNSSFSFESKLVDMFLEDAKSSLKRLTAVDTLAEEWKSHLKKGGEDEYKQPLTFASTHPFVAPFTSVGKIAIPSAWGATAVHFHPLCSTPSADATLEFFTSDESYAAGEPAYSFYGPHDSIEKSTSSFKDFVEDDITTLIYKFHAKPFSHRIKVKWVPIPTQDMKVTVDAEAGISAINVGQTQVPIGLGEDDSLFNLFCNIQESESETTGNFVTTYFDCDPLSSGTWYYEVEIEFKAAKTASTPNDRFLRIGVIDADLCVQTGVEVGSSTGSIGVNPLGEVFFNGDCVQSSRDVSSWHTGDVMSCLLKIEGDEGNFSIWFAKNGCWSAPFAGNCKNLKPAVTLDGSVQLKPNDGSRPLQFRATAEAFVDAKELHAINDRPSSPMMERCAWGYHFMVKPANELLFRCRKIFELIWHSKVKRDGCQDKVWIWRPKSTPKYRGCGDILTTRPFPPRRTIVFDKLQTKPPTSFECVFHCQKSNLVIWRPVPPKGFVALGDVAASTTSSTPSAPSLDLVCCVPLRIVRKCDVATKRILFKKVGEAKTSTNATIWTSDNGLGHFFGSPYESREGTAPRSATFTVSGIGEGWTFKMDIASLLEGEWYQEREVQLYPSLSWTCNMLQFLLSHPSSKLKVLTEDVFGLLVQYLKSTSAPAPINIVPTLIVMIRAANASELDMDLAELNELSKAVITHAVERKTEKAFMKLVDLAVEVQLYQISSSISRDQKSLEALSTTAERGGEAARMGEEAASSGGNDMKELSASSTAAVFDADWWMKMSSIPNSVLEERRIVKRENVDNLFTKESVILKLRQVLKFFNAIGGYQHSCVSPSPSLVHSVAPYPKFMTSKIWVDYASSCLFFESPHPARKREGFSKTIHVPGAKKMAVVVDRRFVIRKGDGFLVSGDEETYSVSGDGSSTSADLIKDLIVVKGDTVKVSLTLSDEGEGGEDEDWWGWAFIVYATGELFSTASCRISLKDKKDSTPDTAPSKDADEGLVPEEPDASSMPLNTPEDSSEPSLLAHGLKSLPSSSSPSRARPQTKRGKRSTDGHEAAPKTPPAPTSGSMLDLVTSHGLLVSEGRLAVPRSTETTLVLEKSFARISAEKCAVLTVEWESNGEKLSPSLPITWHSFILSSIVCREVGEARKDAVHHGREDAAAFEDKAGVVGDSVHHPCDAKGRGGSQDGQGGG